MQHPFFSDHIRTILEIVKEQAATKGDQELSEQNLVKMSRPKSLRKELKDKVCEELSQMDSFHQHIQDDIKDALHNNCSNTLYGAMTKYLLNTMRNDVDQKVADIKKGKLPPHISYEESDQSPVQGMEAAKLAIRCHDKDSQQFCMAHLCRHPPRGVPI